MIRFYRCAPYSLFLLILLQSACQKPAEIKPAYVHQDVHSSGNLVQIAADSKLGVSAGLGGGVSLWSLADGNLVASWLAHDGPVNGLSVLTSQDRLITGGWDGTLKQWDMSGQLLKQLQTGSPVTAMVSDAVTGELVTGHADARIRYWALSDLQPQKALRLQGGRIKSLAYHADSGGYAASDIRGGVWYWTADQLPEQIADLSVYIRTLAFNTDGNQLFGGSWFDLYRWDLPSGSMQALDTDHRGIIADIAWSGVNNDIVSISRQTDASVLSLDPVTGKTRANYGGHDLCGASIDISRDGKYLMTTSDDASVRIWLLGRQE
jgi:WD40 repeat protein